MTDNIEDGPTAAEEAAARVERAREAILREVRPWANPVMQRLIDEYDNAIATQKGTK